MTKVESIEQAVQALSPEEFRMLFEWMAHKDNALWDQQLETDIVSGKLDDLGNAALTEFHAGKCKPI